MRFPIMPQGARRRLCAGVLLASAWLLPAAMAKAEVRLASAEALDTQIAPACDGSGQGRLGDAGFSLMVLGITARDGGNRSLACESWAESLTMLEAGQRSGGIIGFHANYIPGLRAKQAACASGGAIDAPMRDLPQD